MKYTKLELQEYLWDNIDAVTTLLGMKKDRNHYLCPFHADSTGSFSISKDKRVMKCFGCGATVFDPVQLIIKVTGMSEKEALKWIETSFRIKVQYSSSGIDTILDLSKSGLYSEDGIDAVNYLKSRGVDLEAVHNYPIGVLKSATASKKPTKDFLKATLGLSPNSLVFGSLDVLDSSKIGSLKFRDWEKESFTGSKVISVYPVGTKKGLFGPPIKTDNITAIIAEGEIDALCLKSVFYKEDLNFDVYATGGSPSKEMFQNVKFSQIYYVPDSPEKKGYEIAIQFLKSLPETFQWDVKIFNWELFRDIGEDPADAVQKGYGDRFTNFGNYIPAEDFIEYALSYLQINLDEDLEVLRIIKGMPIRISKAFLRKIGKEELASKAINIKDEDLYIEEIKNGITKKFKPLFVLTENKTPSLKFLYKDTSSGNTEFISVELSDPPKTDALVPYLGKDIPSWMLENFPAPEFLLYTASGDSEVTFTERDRRLKSVFSKAIIRIANEVPKRSEMEVLGDGIHYVGDTLVIVNGKSNAFYYSNEENRWKEIDQYTYKDYIIVGQSEFAPGLTVHQLNSKRNLKDVYFETKNLLKKVFVLDKEWKYKIISAFIFYAPIHQVTKQNTFLWLNAEKGSGKTSLMGLLSNTREGVYYKLIEPSLYFSNVTEASLRRSVMNKALTVFMDEFERNQYESIFNLLRQVTDKGHIIRASRDNDTKVTKYKVSFAGVMASINLSPNPADISRVIVISLNTIDKKKIKPFDSVCRKAAPYEYYAELSRNILLASVNSFKEYLKVRETLEENNPYGEFEPRSKANYINLHTILRMVGDEFTEQDLKDIKEAHFIENIEEDLPLHELIEQYMFLLYKIQLNSGKISSLKHVLSSPALIEEFNTMHYPFKVDLDKGLLEVYYRLIQWDKLDKELNSTTVKKYMARSSRFRGVQKGMIYLDVKDLIPYSKKGEIDDGF